MSASTPKVFIKIETAEEQQEILRNSRKTLKTLQRGALDKENLTGRPILTGKTGFVKSKSEFDIKLGKSDLLKRKKVDSKTTATQTPAYESLPPVVQNVAIDAEDLTTDTPSENYWQILAQKRREALEETLEENHFLHDRIQNLEEELETSKSMLEEAKKLVDCLTDMLEENTADSVKIFNDDPDEEASTSGINDSNNASTSNTVLDATFHSVDDSFNTNESSDSEVNTSSEI